MTRIAYLASGHGYGHAARDLRIIRSLRKLRPDIEIEIASQGTGVDYFRSRGVPCTDLEIPESAMRTTESGRRIWRHLAGSGPLDLVVADEFMQALRCCDHLGVDCVYLTEWFSGDFGKPEPDLLLNLAREVLFVDFPRAHPVPPEVTVPVVFTGPIVDDFRAAEPARGSVREQLGLGPDARITVLTLGGMPWRRESALLTGRVLRAWGRGATDRDHLVIMAPPKQTPGGTESESAAGIGHPALRNIHWIGLTPTPEDWYREAAVVLADAMGFTVCELVWNRVPVLALTDPAVTEAFGHSFRRRVEFLERSGLIVTAGRELSPEGLWQLMAQQAAAPRASAQALASVEWGVADRVAERILACVDEPRRPLAQQAAVDAH
jgi:hypothetical protein